MIIERLNKTINIDNCLRTSVKQPMFARPRLDIELFTNQKCLQLKPELTQP